MLRTSETIAAAAATALTAPTTNGKETSIHISQTRAMHPSKMKKQETVTYHTDHHDNKTATTIKPNK